MKNLKTISFLFVLVLALFEPEDRLWAQTTSSGTDLTDSQRAEVDSFLFKLPPLELLIDSAVKRAPIIKGQDLNIARDKLAISRLRMNWSKDIIVGGINVNYGLFDNLIISKDLGVDQLNTKNSQQTRYTLGLSMKLPISYFYDHFDLKMAKIQLEQAHFEKESVIRSMRELVYNRYNDLLGAYRKYMILLEDIDAYNILLQNAEKDFLSNQISVTEITAVKMANSKARLELSDAENNFVKARWFLEELTGVRIK
jgi:outer membrane protein TolC